MDTMSKQLQNKNIKWNQALHSPYIQLHFLKNEKPKYPYQRYLAYDHYGNEITSADTMGNLNFKLNRFFSV